jgi:hypothetical protein
MNPDINSGTCSLSSTQYNYSSLSSLQITYGGSGVNHADWTEPGLLIGFGVGIFIPASLCCICILCSAKKREHQPLAFVSITENPIQSDLSYTEEDNIL